MKTRRSVVAALMLAACGPATASGAASDDAIAAFAGPEPQFRAILPRIVFSTQSMAMASYNLGIAENCAIVRPQFQAAVARHLPAWRSNLVKAYRDNVPAATLAVAVGGGPAGREALRPYIGKIAAQMEAASKPLLFKAAADVIKPSVDAAMKVDFKSVNGVLRQREMAAAEADGSLFCGLQSSAGGVK